MSALESRLAEALEGSYTLEGEIGRGGMGVVYKARDIKLQRPVAIKVLPPELGFRADIRARFLREAQTAARLAHPHIVPIHIVGEAGDLVYFVMGLVDGESLALRVKRRHQLSIDEARRVLRETADALSAAHQQGVIHRDIKPDNILLEGTRGRVMVTDFGIAKALSSSSHTLTEAGVAIGTPAFMSPEQAAGDRDIDGRSDLYSLGVVGYHMLTGELPFRAESVPALLVKQITESPTPVDVMRPDMPRELAQTVMRCLEKDPEDRWPTADALRRALETNTYTAPPPRAGTARRSRAGRVPLPPLPSRRGSASRSSMNSDAARDWLDGRRSGGDLSPRRSRGLDRISRKLDKKQEEEKELERLSKESGEPLMVTRFRSNLARYAAVNGMLMLVSTVGGAHFPWYIVAGFWGIGIAQQYARLWTSGYSWKDVIHRPPAHDAIAAKSSVRTPLLAPVTVREFGSYTAPIEQARADRVAVMAMLGRLSNSERAMIQEDIGATVDSLLQKLTELARTLALMEQDFGDESLDRVDARIAAVEAEGDSHDRERRMSLLRAQREKVEALSGRRVDLQSRFDACVLAMQNVRFDLLRLRSSGVAEALGDLTQATQQARAVSRNVDDAISAAAEVQRLTRNL